jgi:hypothetical protein
VQRVGGCTTHLWRVYRLERTIAECLSMVLCALVHLQ